MNLHATIAGAVRAGATVYLDGGEVRCRAPKEALLPELRQALADHRDELRRLLSLPGDTPEYATAWIEHGEALGCRREVDRNRQVERRPRPCYLCGGTRRRARPGGDTICATCHPEEARPSFSLDHLSGRKGKRR